MKEINQKVTNLERSLKRCSTCREFFALSRFGPDKRKRDGLQPQCRTCRRLSALKYTKTEKGKATVERAKKRYRQTDKGRETEKQYKSTVPSACPVGDFCSTHHRVLPCLSRFLLADHDCFITD